MSTLEELTVRVREALSVDSSYDASIIPFAIQRTMRRLLRDYHFPWAIKKKVYGAAPNPLTAAQQDYALPAGMKKELAVLFYDSVDDSYSSPLLKREGMQLLGSDGQPRFYWLWSGYLSTDLKVPADLAAQLQLHFWFESQDPEDNEEWLLEKFEDVVFTYSVFRLAAEKGKKELAEIYAMLWKNEDQPALAIYLNELEFDNMEFVQREANGSTLDRYPVQ